MSIIAKFITPIRNSRAANCRCISSTNSLFIDKKWRKQKGLTDNPVDFGPLTNLPDYTFMDGRATPLGSNQRKRLLKQREIAQKMVTMCKEIDFAQERFEKQKQEKQLEKQKILANKFKPKGHLLLRR